ncbi:enoyl-CoA delta isomerase 1, mitochondrial-like [Thrips palmi]|uniref:Enoyl-CoA delta isomerase 1, mitochondrial n=1 Tax=Thrips palmi TaxID=161013 RepID=A0A6P8XZC4_THRPL|nr:enoyl-CoA delta isomerase 1, mitochondrial-like [Thrips palmi]XP_034232498.1 enoyl-CoA delta isomerase 1, mitochondrial-like [Thrips palmi]
MAVVCRNLRAFAQKTSSLRCTPNFLRLYSQSKPAPPKLVTVDVDKAGVATVTLDRPPVNSLNTGLLEELGVAIKDLEANKTRGIILTSSSNSVFSAGLDILEMYEPKKQNLSLFWTTLQNTWLSLYRTSIPTVAAINGHAPAGGCLLALSCEYRVMVGPKFTIGLNETQLGIVAPQWFMICMKDAVGRRQAEMALTAGKMFSTQEALNIGLIDKMVSNKEEAIAEAQKFIAQFAKIPPLARRMTKESIRQEGIKYMEENAIDDLKAFMDLVVQPNIQKGLGMYLEAMKKSK